MKWLRRGLLVLLVGGGIVALGLAWTRPGWWPAWAGLGGSGSTTDDERREHETGTATAAEDGKGPPGLVRLASARLARRFGIETAVARRERHAHRLVCNAETAYDARHSAEVLARVSGVLGEVRA